MREVRQYILAFTPGEVVLALKAAYPNSVIQSMPIGADVDASKHGFTFTWTRPVTSSDGELAEPQPKPKARKLGITA